MYGLPRDVDLSFLEGITLTQLCFGEHQLIFNFVGTPAERSVSISVESSVSLKYPDGSAHKWEDFREGAGFLVALLSQTVAEAKGSTDGTLTLEFQVGGRLEIYDDSKQYESYTIREGDRVIVV